MKPALQGCVADPTYVAKKFGNDDAGEPKDKAKPIIDDPLFWKQAYFLTRAVWPLLRLLRLGDRDGAVLGELFNCAVECEIALEKSTNINDGAGCILDQIETEATDGAGEVMPQIVAAFNNYKPKLMTDLAKAAYAMNPALVEKSSDITGKYYHEVIAAFQRVAIKFFHKERPPFNSADGKTAAQRAASAVESLTSFRNLREGFEKTEHALMWNSKYPGRAMSMASSSPAIARCAALK